MISWTTFIASYSIISLALFVAASTRWAYFRWPAIKVVSLGLLTSLPLDAIAERRGFWVFRENWGVTFFSVPVENVLFIAATVSNALILLNLFAAPMNVGRRNQNHHTQ